MTETNPFGGIRTYGGYWGLWWLTAAVVLLQAGATVLVVLAERRWGLEFTALEGMVPVYLVTGLAAWAVLARMGVEWRPALAGWRRGFRSDAPKALKYFGGYLLVVAAIVAVIMAGWLLLGGEKVWHAMEPVTGKAAREGAALQAAAAASRLRLAAAFVSACVLAPLVEEVFFRRLFYTTLRRRNGFAVSAFWSGLFFALFHGAAAPLMLPVGFYFCWVYERERRLPVNIMLHSLVNLAMLFNRMIA